MRVDWLERRIERTDECVREACDNCQKQSRELNELRRELRGALTDLKWELRGELRDAVSNLHKEMLTITQK